MNLFHKNRKRVLIVDDEPLVVEVTKDFLQEEGFDTSSAGTAVAAIQSMAKEPADLMLLDISLPDQNGLKFLVEFKKNHPHVPVIILTGSGYDDTLMHEALKSGASGYVSKDTDMENMVITVKRLLKHRESHQIPRQG